MLVEGGQVHCPPRLPVLFGHYDHPGLPFRGNSWWNLLDDAQITVSVQVLLDGVPPVVRDGDWFVDSHGIHAIFYAYMKDCPSGYVWNVPVLIQICYRWINVMVGTKANHNRIQYTGTMFQS